MSCVILLYLVVFLDFSPDTVKITQNIHYRVLLTGAESKMSAFTYYDTLAYQIFIKLCIFPSLGFVMDRFVLQYHWKSLKNGLNYLKIQTGLKSSEVAYGISFNTISYNQKPNLRNETQEWADFLTGFFQKNVDNENIMIATALKSLSTPVSVSFFLLKITLFQLIK